MQSYHHGNLKQALIEAGIHLINQEGMQQLSLRKLAAACEVSHAAPYNHFKNKEELIQAIKDHITQDFSNELVHCIEIHCNHEDLLVELGLAYIHYFIKHKHYYRFLIAHFNFHVVIKEKEIACEDFSAFSLYRDVAISYMKTHQISETEFSVNVLTTWAIVEGLTSIFVSEHTICEVNQDDFLRKLLQQKICI